MKKKLLILAMLFLSIMAIERVVARIEPRKNIEVGEKSSISLKVQDADSGLTESALDQDSYCAQCCGATFGQIGTDPECCRRCNRCQLYSDGGNSKCDSYSGGI